MLAIVTSPKDSVVVWCDWKKDNASGLINTELPDWMME